MNMQEILAKTEEAQAIAEEQVKIDAKKAYEEKTSRIIDAISARAAFLIESEKFTPKWMKKESAQLDSDIHTFIREGNYYNLIEKGCGVFFGKNNYQDALAIMDFGTYVLSIENPTMENARFPKALIINIMAPFRLKKCLEPRLGITPISYEGINEILFFERFGKMSFKFVSRYEIPKDAEVTVLGDTTTMIGNKELKVTAVAYTVSGNKILITRTDWGNEKNVPKNLDFEFRLRYK